MPGFYDRHEDKRWIQYQSMPVLIIFGAQGVGKSSLLDELKSDLGNSSFQDSLVMKIDLDGLDAWSEQAVRIHVVDQMLEELQGRLRVAKGLSTEEKMSRIAVTLRESVGWNRVLVMFDTTESIPDNRDFWSWLGANLIKDLTGDGIRFVFAGRTPVRFHYPVNKFVAIRELEPLPISQVAGCDRTFLDAGAAASLVKDVLQEQGMDDADCLEEAIDMILELSFGHPDLSIQLASRIVERHGNRRVDDLVRCDLAHTVIKPVIENAWLSGLETDWKRTIWLASVLRYFDNTMLEWYIADVAPDLVVGKGPAFFISGLSNSTMNHCGLLWKNGAYQWTGRIGDIIGSCFRITDNSLYDKACSCAASVLRRYAADPSIDVHDYDWFIQEADRLEAQVSHLPAV